MDKRKKKREHHRDDEEEEVVEGPKKRKKRAPEKEIIEDEDDDNYTKIIDLTLLPSSFPLPPPEKRKVSAIDIGVKNMGIAQNSNGNVRACLTTIFATLDGRMYNYNEGQLPGLCRQWIATVRPFWEGSQLIYLERQFSKFWLWDRHCLLIEKCLESEFLTLHLEHPTIYPKPVCIDPKIWKRDMGVAVGSGSHYINKKLAIAEFIKIWGQEAFDHIERTWDKSDDVVEVTIQSEFIMRNFEKLYRPEIYLKHVEDVGSHRNRFSEEERWIELKPLHPPPEGSVPPAAYVDLRREYILFYERQKKEEEHRKEKKMLKNDVKRLKQAIDERAAAKTALNKYWESAKKKEGEGEGVLRRGKD